MSPRPSVLAGVIGILWGCLASAPGAGPAMLQAAEVERPKVPPGQATRPAHAPAATPHLSGQSGRVTWEVVDVIQTRLAEEQAIRWDFAIVLRLVSGEAIRVERIEHGTGTRTQGERSIDVLLRPGESLRIQHNERTGRGESRRDAFRRYHGRDDKGVPLVVEARVPLDARLGARPAPAPSTLVAPLPIDVPLPPDLRVVPPGPAVPAAWARFSGVWTGRWGGTRDHVLVVEEMGERDAIVVYAVGAQRDRPGAWWRRKARMAKDWLVVELFHNERATYAPGDGKALAGTWTSDDGRVSRVKLEARVARPEQVGSDALLARAAVLGREALTALLDGQYADALPKAQEALAIRETRLGPTHPDVAASLTTLAEVYRGQGKLDDAERLHLRALSIREAQLGRDHPDVAASLNSHAVLHNARATYREAEGLLTRALAIVEKTPGSPAKTNRVKAEVLENLAKVYRAQGRLGEAEEAQAKATILWAAQ